MHCKLFIKLHENNMKLKKSRIQLISCYLLVYLMFRKPVRSLLLLPCTSVIHGAAHVISPFFNDIYSSTKQCTCLCESAGWMVYTNVFTQSKIQLACFSFIIIIIYKFVTQ